MVDRVVTQWFVRHDLGKPCPRCGVVPVVGDLVAKLAGNVVVHNGCVAR